MKTKIHKVIWNPFRHGDHKNRKREHNISRKSISRTYKKTRHLRLKQTQPLTTVINSVLLKRNLKSVESKIFLITQKLKK